MKMRKSSVKRLVASLTPADVRQVFRQRNLLLDKGATPDDPVIVGVDVFRQSYIQQVGLACYLEKVLGTHKNSPCDNIKLIYKNRHEELVENTTPISALSKLSVDNLPYRVVIYPANKDEEINLSV